MQLSLIAQDLLMEGSGPTATALIGLALALIFCISCDNQGDPATDSGDTAAPARETIRGVRTCELHELILLDDTVGIRVYNEVGLHDCPDDWLAQIKESVTELPAEKRARYTGEYGLSEVDADNLLDDPRLTNFYEATIAAGTALESLFIGRLRRKPDRLAASLFSACDRARLPEHAQPVHPVLEPFQAAVLSQSRAA